ncbi:MAG: M15 family metallopeptidase [Lachnospiraceae bacterium]|nr:M15 family metallopeptidase [Lachnospiraceae bacterium]
MSNFVKSFVNNKLWCYLLIGIVAASVIVVPSVMLYKKTHTVYSPLSGIEIPVNWDSNYVENIEDYEQQFIYDDVAWSSVAPEDEERFAAVTIDAELPPAEFAFAADGYASVSVHSQTATDKEIALMSENEAWEYVTNGLWSEYPKSSFKENKSKLVELQQTNTETITVKVWYWANPEDDSDMRKVTKTKMFAVNSKLAETFIHIFDDIYNDPSKPIINLADSAMGTWVLRGKNHNDSRTMSGHSLGTTIDINPSTGSFNVNGTWYGNAYGQKAMPEYIWKQLPESHDKYHVLYNGCPIVEIFKSYGFYWGGDWKSGTDSMHLAYLGDGGSAREAGIQNYKDRINE